MNCTTLSVLVTVMAVTSLAKAKQVFERASTAVPFTTDIGNRKQIFLDDLMIAEVHALSQFQVRPAKYAGNPVGRSTGA